MFSCHINVDKGQEFSGKQEEIPLFLLITVPAVAGLICITVILIFWRRHVKVSNGVC